MVYVLTVVLQLVCLTVVLVNDLSFYNNFLFYVCHLHLRNSVNSTLRCGEAKCAFSAFVVLCFSVWTAFLISFCSACIPVCLSRNA